MRITLERSGGFAAIPGRNRPVTLDTADLPNAEQVELESLVRSAGLAALEPAVPPPGSADMRTYRLTVEDENVSQTAQFTDPMPNEFVHALVRHLDSRRT